MIRFTDSLDVALPVEEVFEALADMTVLDRWNPNVTESVRLTGNPLEVGSQYQSIIRRPFMQLRARSELVAVDAPHLVEYQGTISGFWSVDRLTFEPTDTGTRVTFFNESTPPVWLRPVSPLLNALFPSQARRAVEGARQFLES